jgi:1-phosphatidylinositol-3-phosphate 5-kinase
VSRLAQDLLLEQGITLVLNVKPAVLERLARLTQADILTCVDAHVGKPRLGMCHNFFLRKFHLDNTACNTKTLMFFDGCATHLGCTVILRGGACDELRRLKKVISHMILVNYSWKLEKSFLMDEFAMPPSVPNDIFFADEELKEPKDGNSESHPVVSKSCPDGSTVAKLGDGKEKRKMQSRTASKEKGLCGVEDKKTEAVVDQSDPLHQYLTGENQAAGEDAQQLSVATLPLANRFRKALDGTVLSSSPYLQYSVPFLEMEAGRQCALRRYFPEQVFCSPQLAACSSTFTE